jgi:hypothetical protein
MDELRARLRRAEDDARAARFLAGGADRDTAELRAEVREFRAETRAEFADVRAEMRGFRDQNNRVLSAMREDLTDLREHVDRGFAGIQEQFAQVDRNFLTVTSKVDGLAAGLQLLTELLTRRERDDPSPS